MEQRQDYVESLYSLEKIDHDRLAWGNEETHCKSRAASSKEYAVIKL
jgi:hypothetical protein